MATRDESFPSKYLKAADLGGKAITVTIASAVQETLKSPEKGEEVKTVLSFKGGKKTLPLNMTNWDSVADITGEGNSDNWPGYKIQLYPAKTEMKGKPVDCIRVREPDQRELKPKAAATKRPIPPSQTDDPFYDDVPFTR
jgi:hypothetical protein